MHTLVWGGPWKSSGFIFPKSRHYIFKGAIRNKTKQWEVELRVESSSGCPGMVAVRNEVSCQLFRYRVG